LMVYRTYVLWCGNLHVMILPFIFFFGAVVSSIVLLIELAIPNASEAPGSLIAVMGTAFLSLSVSSNITSTLLISGQLLRHRRALRRVGLESSVLYTGIIAIIAESAALYSGCGLIYIPLYARDLSSQFAVSALYVSLGSITPVIVTIRIALGIATDHTHPSMVLTTKTARMEASQILASRSSQEASVGTFTLYPTSKSPNTLAEGSDVHTMNHFKRGEMV